MRPQHERPESLAIIEGGRPSHEAPAAAPGLTRDAMALLRRVASAGAVRITLGCRHSPRPPPPRPLSASASYSSGSGSGSSQGYGASSFQSYYDPYTLLGVSRGCTEAELKKAYRKAALTHHPDRQVANGNDPAAAERIFKQVRPLQYMYMYHRTLLSSLIRRMILPRCTARFSMSSTLLQCATLAPIPSALPAGRVSLPAPPSPYLHPLRAQ